MQNLAGEELVHAALRTRLRKPRQEIGASMSSPSIADDLGKLGLSAGSLKPASGGTLKPAAGTLKPAHAGVHGGPFHSASSLAARRRTCGVAAADEEKAQKTRGKRSNSKLPQRISFSGCFPHIGLARQETVILLGQ